MISRRAIIGAAAASFFGGRGAGAVAHYGLPVAIDWSNPATQNLIGFWDLTSGYPIDFAGNFPQLTSGRAGANVSTSVGLAQAVSDATPGGGVWHIGVPAVVNTMTKFSMMSVAGLAAPGDIPAVIVEICSSTSTDNRVGFNLNGADVSSVRMAPHYINGAFFDIGVTQQIIPADSSMRHFAVTFDLSNGGNMLGYVGGALQSTTALQADVLTGLDTMTIGCRLNQAANYSGTFTNGSPVVTDLGLSGPNINQTIAGSGIPANTYLPRSLFGTGSTVSMSANFTGSSGVVPFTLSGPMSCGSALISIVALWNRVLSATEIATNAANPTSLLVYTKDLVRFGSDRSIMRWLRENENWRERRMA